jgi:hypothetical protein
MSIDPMENEHLNYTEQFSRVSGHFLGNHGVTCCCSDIRGLSSNKLRSFQSQYFLFTRSSLIRVCGDVANELKSVPYSPHAL